MGNSTNRFASWFAILFVAAWILIWSGATLLFDRMLVQSIAQQLRALTFPNAPGVVTASRVVTESGGEGTSYKAVVEYTYSARGNKHFGNTVRHGSFEIGSGDARRIVARFPAGSQVPVYFDPQNPMDSVLLPGLCAGQAFMALFLIPFNLIMLAGWFGVWQCLFAGRQGHLPWGALLRPTYDGFELRFYSITPLTAALGGLLGTSFAGIFLVGFGSIVLPAEPLVAVAWLAAIVIPIRLAIRQRQRAVVLEANELRGTFEIHDARHRRPTTSGTFGELKGVAIRERTRRDSDGDISRTYAVAFVLAPGKERIGRRCLVSGWTKDLARQLAEWLSQRLKLPVQGPLA